MMRGWRGFARRIALALLLGSFLATAAGAQTPGLYQAVQEQEAAIAGLDVQLVRSQARRAAVEAQRQAGERRLRRLAARQAALGADLTGGRRRLDAVLRFLYEDGSAALLDVLLSSTSFRDFVTRLDFVRRVAAYDVGVLRRVAQERRDLARTAAAAERQQRSLDREAVQLRQVVGRLQALEAQHRAALANASSQLVAFDQALLKGLPGLQDLLDHFSQMPWANLTPDGVQVDYASREVTALVRAGTVNAYFGANVPQFSGFAFSFDARGATLSGRGVTLSGPLSATGGRLVWSPDALDVGGAPAPPSVLQGLLSGTRLEVPVPSPAAGLALVSAATGPDALRLVFAP
jgi:hypothetical protein